MGFRSLTLTGEQIRAARALARIDQADLARRCGLSLETIKRLERIRGPVDANSRTLNAIGEAFRIIGIEFERGEGVGVWFAGGATPPASHPARGAERTHRLIYFSTLSPDVETGRQLLGEISETSRRRNMSLGVTGALLACDRRFLQALEGDKQAVQQIYGAISADPRHFDLRVIESRPIAQRQFQEWSFCCGLTGADRALVMDEPALRDGFRPELLTPMSAVGLLSLVRDLHQSVALSAGRAPAGGASEPECVLEGIEQSSRRARAADRV